MKVTQEPDGRLIAPAASRNTEVIAERILAEAPAEGRALEIASGTGQHIAHLAPLTPGLDWQPSEPDPERLSSIAAWRAFAGAPNIRPPLALDARQAGWGAAQEPFDLILAVNLLQIIPQEACDAVLTEVTAALAPGGVLMIYGPFLRDGQATSPGDADFDAMLRARGPGHGLKDSAWLEGRLAPPAFASCRAEPMPANNLMWIARRA